MPTIAGTGLDRIPHRLAVPLLLALFAAAAAYAATRDAATYDEGIHLGAGFAIIDRADYRLNPDHPPLPRVWGALPVWLLGLRRPDFTAPGWTGTDPVSGRRLNTTMMQQQFGYELLNGPMAQSQRLDTAVALLPARLMMILPGLALCLVVYDWGLRMWGRSGGLVTLFFCALSPSVLAHAHLVTTDLFAALGFTATLYAFWRFTRRPSWGWAVATGCALGAAILSKFSALLLVPILLAAAVLWSEGPWDAGRLRAQRRRRAAGSLGLAFFIAYGCLWAGYGFRYSASAAPDFAIDWSFLGLTAGPWERLVTFARTWKLAPEGCLYGVANLAGSLARFSYLNGKISYEGWWYYLPEAFLLKTPPALLLLVPWIAIAGLRRTRGRSFDGWFLALPVLLYSANAMAARMSIGHRHIFPVEPFLLVATGGLAPLIAARGWPSKIGVALLGGYLVSFSMATPRYLSYFNLTVGGRANAWRFLGDSNLDWGQDLIRLREWMRDNDVPQVDLAYFGGADPRALGIDYRKIYLLPDYDLASTRVAPRSGDVLAVSVTFLQGIYLSRDGLFAEVMLRDRPDLFAAAREWNQLVHSVHDAQRQGGSQQSIPPLAEWMVGRALITPEQRADAESKTLYALLERVRDHLTPIGRAGDSIILYRIP